MLWTGFEKFTRTALFYNYNSLYNYISSTLAFFPNAQIIPTSWNKSQTLKHWIFFNSRWLYPAFICTCPLHHLYPINTYSWHNLGWSWSCTHLDLTMVTFTTAISLNIPVVKIFCLYFRQQVGFSPYVKTFKKNNKNKKREYYIILI